jgi:hypothetical protein
MELNILLRMNQGAIYLCKTGGGKGYQGRGKGRLSMDTGGGGVPATHIRPPCQPLLGHRRSHEGDRRVSPCVAHFQVRLLVQVTKRSRVTRCSRHILTMGSHNMRSRSRKCNPFHTCAPHRDNTNTGLALLHMRRPLQDLRILTVAQTSRRSHNQWQNLKDKRAPLFLLHVLHLYDPRLSELAPRSAHGQIRLQHSGSGPLEVICPRATMTVMMTRSLNGYLVWMVVVVRVDLWVWGLVGVQGRENLEEGQSRLPQDYLVGGSASPFYFTPPFLPGS